MRAIYRYDDREIEVRIVEFKHSQIERSNYIEPNPYAIIAFKNGELHWAWIWELTLLEEEDK